MKATKARKGYVDRGMQFPAYPSHEQIRKIESLQPSLKACWNWLVSRIEEVLLAREARAIREGLLPGPISKPNYKGLQPEKAKALKAEYVKQCEARRKSLSDLPIPIEWRPFLAGKDSEAERLGMRQDYQVLNNYLSFKGLPELPAVLLQTLVMNFNAKRTTQKRKRFRRQYDVMPVQVKSGEFIRKRSVDKGLFGLQRKCNYEVNLPVAGWIPVYLDAGLINQLLTPGNTVRRGCTLRYDHGKWYASVNTIRREVKYSGPGDNSVCGIDPGLDKLITVSDGQILKNPRNLKYDDARNLALSIASLGEGQVKFLDNETSKQMCQAVYRHDARQRRRVLTQCRQLAAKLCDQYDFIGIESNSGLALGIGSRFTGGSRIFYACLVHRCGANRIREIDSFYNSQTCSECGTRDKGAWARKIGEKNQTCKCTTCGYAEDRDVNAAKNIRNKLAKMLFNEYSSSDNIIRPGIKPEESVGECILPSFEVLLPAGA